MENINNNKEIRGFTLFSRKSNSALSSLLLPLSMRDHRSEKALYRDFGQPCD